MIRHACARPGWEWVLRVQCTVVPLDGRSVCFAKVGGGHVVNISAACSQMGVCARTQRSVTNSDETMKLKWPSKRAYRG